MQPSPPISQQQYIDLLERVNGQLALTWTPWSVIFTALAVIVAIVSIVVGALFYFQGREYRSQLKRALTRFQAVFDESMKRQQQLFETLLSEKKAELGALKEELVELKTDAEESTGEEKKRLDRRIARLEGRLDSMKSETDSIADAAARVLKSSPHYDSSAYDAPLFPGPSEPFSVAQRQQLRGVLYEVFGPQCEHCQQRLPIDVVASAVGTADSKAQCPHCHKFTHVDPGAALQAESTMISDSGHRHGRRST